MLERERNWTIKNVDETILKHLTNCTSMKNFMFFEIISDVSAHLKRHAGACTVIWFQEIMTMDQKSKKRFIVMPSTLC